MSPALPVHVHANLQWRSALHIRVLSSANSSQFGYVGYASPGFIWVPGQTSGQIALELVCTFPDPNTTTRCMDPGWWTTCGSGAAYQEIDFVENWGYSASGTGTLGTFLYGSNLTYCGQVSGTISSAMTGNRIGSHTYSTMRPTRSPST